MAELDNAAQRLRKAEEVGGVFPVPERGTLTVTGSERCSWLNGLLTCDVARLEAGQARWGFLLGTTAKIQSVVWVVAGVDRLWLSLSPGTLRSVYAELDQRLIMEDAELQDVSVGSSWYLAVGSGGRAAHPFGPDAVRAPLDLLGVGEEAVVVPRDPDGQRVEEDVGVQLGELEWTLLRLRRGLGEFGVDFDQQMRPHDTALERRAVSWSKGCYLGQEAVCMQEMRGKVKRALRVLTVDAPEAAAIAAGANLCGPTGAPVSVTSSAFDADRRCWLVMAQLPLADVQSNWSLTWNGERYGAALMTEPL